MERRITMADVANRVGLSKAAVSVVLNGHPSSRVSAETAARIRAAAEELGYRPNLTARSLSTRRSGVLGFVSELTATERFGGGLIRGALREAKARGHVLFITETEASPEAAREAVEVLVDHQIDGLIYATARPREIELPERSGSVPWVVVNAESTQGVPVILPDEFEGGRSIVDLLLSAGHTRNLVVIGRRRHQPVDQWYTTAVRRRMEGIHAALDAHDVTPIAEVACEPWSLETGYAALRELLDASVRPKAVVCLNDRIAFGVYRALAEAGLEVPTDVSVVSFDDDDIALYLQPTLTTAALPYEEMGALAVRLLLTAENSEVPPETLVPLPIRLRGSIAGVTPEPTSRDHAY